MEDLPLNEAHREHRKAENFEQKGDFEKAIACHELAAALLIEVLSQSHNTRVIENIEFQHQYHLNRVCFLSLREKAKMSGIIVSKGTTTGSVGSTVSSSSPCISRQFSSIPHRNGLIEQINKNEDKLHHLIVSLHKLCVESSSVSSPKIQQSSNGADAVKEVCDVTQRLSISNGMSNEEASSIPSIIEDIKSIQNLQSQLTSRLSTDMSSLENENKLLLEEINELKIKLSEVEKERDKIREDCSSHFRSSSPELPPLDLPPLYFDLTPNT